MARSVYGVFGATVIVHGLPDRIQYLQPWARLGKAQAVARDEQLAREVRAWCEEQVENLRPPVS